MTTDDSRQMAAHRVEFNAMRVRAVQAEARETELRRALVALHDKMDDFNATICWFCTHTDNCVLKQARRALSEPEATA